MDPAPYHFSSFPSHTHWCKLPMSSHLNDCNGHRFGSSNSNTHYFPTSALVTFSLCSTLQLWSSCQYDINQTMPHCHLQWLPISLRVKLKLLTMAHETLPCLVLRCLSKLTKYQSPPRLLLCNCADLLLFLKLPKHFMPLDICACPSLSPEWFSWADISA